MARTTALKATWWANYNSRLMLNNIMADAFELVELGEVFRRKVKKEEAARRKEVWVAQYREGLMRHLVEGMVDKAWAVHSFSHEVEKWREDLDFAKMRTADTG
jgi:hypothetical protein